MQLISDIFSPSTISFLNSIMARIRFEFLLSSKYILHLRGTSGFSSFRTYCVHLVGRVNHYLQNRAFGLIFLNRELTCFSTEEKSQGQLWIPRPLLSVASRP
jgi:hypothetical protein